MGFFQNRLHKKLAAYQREIMETHYRETETMYQEMRAGGTTSATTSSC